MDGSDTNQAEGELGMNVALSSDQPFTASLNCGAGDGGTDASHVTIQTVRINALAVDNLQSQ